MLRHQGHNYDFDWQVEWGRVISSHMICRSMSFLTNEVCRHFTVGKADRYYTCASYDNY